MITLLDDRSKSNHGNYDPINFTIVAHKTGGYRLKLSRELTHLLDLDEDSYVKIGIDENSIRFEKVEPDDENFYISYNKGIARIYSKYLVQILISHFTLDFVDRSSLTFDASSIIEGDTGKGVKFPIIKNQ